jgi:hypothetical protein
MPYMAFEDVISDVISECLSRVPPIGLNEALQAVFQFFAKNIDYHVVILL